MVMTSLIIPNVLESEHKTERKYFLISIFESIKSINTINFNSITNELQMERPWWL